MTRILHTPRHIAAAVFAASAGMIGFALVSQYGFGLDPCQLCYYQRISYYANLVLAPLAFLLNRRAACGVLLLCALSFLATASIGAFHVGVEQHWWKGLESCSNYALPQGASVEELKKFIMSRNPTSCDIPAFVLFGISMAGYNAMIATILAAITFYLTGKQWRKQ